MVTEVVIPSREVIDDDELHELLFCNLEHIYQMHAGFLVHLEQVLSEYNHHLTKISSVIFC